MKTEEYAKMFREEQSHWFFEAKRRFIQAFLKKRALPSDPLIFDAGCGTGANHLFLEQYGKIVSMDLSEDALAFCRQRSLKRLIRGNLNEMSFKNESFDMVASLDVLYHSWVTDDLALLKKFNAALKSHGLLLITDSAFPFLMSQHDKAVMTRERYTIPALSGKLSEAGFKVLHASYMFFTTFPALFAVRMAQKLFSSETTESNVYSMPAPINRIILKILDLEAWFLSRTALPFGSSVIVIAEKSS